MDLAFLAQIVHHSKRIGSLYMYLKPQIILDFLSKVWTDLPLLSAIKLESTEYGINETKLDAIPLPSLRSICVGCIPIALPWQNCQNIIYFTIDGIPDKCITMEDI